MKNIDDNFQTVFYWNMYGLWCVCWCLSNFELKAKMELNGCTF